MLISKSKIISLVVVFGIGLLLSIYLFKNVRSWENKTKIATFEEVAGDIKDNLQKQIDRDLEVLYSVGSFYKGSNFVDANEFKTFTFDAIQRHPEIQSIEWIPLVKTTELKEFKQQYNLPLDFEIFAYSEEDNRIPSPSQNFYLPLTYAEPIEKNKSVLGMDYSSNQTLSKAMEEARNTGNAVISAKVKLHRLKDPNKNATFLFLPIYQKDKDLKSMQDRHEALQGFVALVIKANLIASDVFEDYSPKFKINLYCDTEKKPENLLYESTLQNLKDTKANSLTKDEIINVANKHWLISISSNPQNIGLQNWSAYSALMAGLISTFFLTYYLYFLLRQNALIRREVDKQTQHLEEEIGYQKKLKENLKIFERALQATQNGVIITDYRLPDNPIIYVNQGFENITGYSANEALGKNCRFLQGEDPNQENRKMLRQAIYDEKPCHILIKNKKKNEESFINELFISPIQDENQKTTHFVGIQQDVTEKESLKNKLLSTNIIQDSILNSANFTIISTDPVGLIKTFNRHAEKLLGYKAEEMINKVTPELIHDPQEIVERAKALSTELKHDIKPGFEVFVAKASLGIPDENQWTYIRKDGSRFQVRLSVTALFNSEGVIIGYLGIGQDLTEILKTREKMEKYNHMIERLEKVSVGREIEMIELKKQLKELREKTNKA